MELEGPCIFLSFDHHYTTRGENLLKKELFKGYSTPSGHLPFLIEPHAYPTDRPTDRPFFRHPFFNLGPLPTPSSSALDRWSERNSHPGYYWAAELLFFSSLNTPFSLVTHIYTHKLQLGALRNGVRTEQAGPNKEGGFLHSERTLFQERKRQRKGLSIVGSPGTDQYNNYSKTWISEWCLWSMRLLVSERPMLLRNWKNGFRKNNWWDNWPLVCMLPTTWASRPVAWVAGQRQKEREAIPPPSFHLPDKERKGEGKRWCCLFFSF